MGGTNGGGPDNIYFPGAFLAYLCKRGKFPGERRWIYAGAGRMRLARGGIFGPGMPRRAPMNS